MENLEPLYTDSGIVKWCITKDKYFMHLHEVLRAVKFWEKQSSPVVARGWEPGTWGVSVLIAHQASLVAQRIKCLPAKQETRVWSLGGKIPWRRKWKPTPVFLPGESHGQRSLAGYSPQGRKESDTTERLHTHTHTHTHRMKRVLEIGCTVMWRELTILIHLIKNHPDGKFMLCTFPTVLKNLMRNKNGNWCASFGNVPVLESRLCHFLGIWPWTSHITY